MSAGGMDVDWKKLYAIYNTLPGDREELWLWIKVFLGIDIPKKALYKGSNAPFDYVYWAFQKIKARLKGRDYSGDCVVLAGRGSGKTMNGAVISFLEAKFVPGIQVRILGGCLTGRTRVFTHKGVVKISEVEEGDIIWSGDRACQVLAKFERNYKGKVFSFSVNPKATRGLRLTPEHKILTDRGWEEAWRVYELIKHSGRLKVNLCVPVSFGNQHLEWYEAFVMGLVWARKLYPASFSEQRTYEMKHGEYIITLLNWLPADLKRMVTEAIDRFVVSCGGPFYTRGSRSFRIRRVMKYIQLFVKKEVLDRAFDRWFCSDATEAFLRFGQMEFTYQFDLETLKWFVAGALVSKLEGLPKDDEVCLGLNELTVSPFATLLTKIGLCGFSARRDKIYLGVEEVFDFLRLQLTPSFVDGSLVHIRPRNSFAYEHDGKVYDLSIDGADAFNACNLYVHNSLSQSEKMYLHILRFAQRPFIGEDIENLTQRNAVFRNGSVIEILPHSVKQVRSAHVDVIRCDEVDEFNRKVWSALQFSAKRIEKISTRQYADGIMSEEIEKAKQLGDPIFRWTIFDVAAKCNLFCVGTRSGDCPIYRYCNRILKKASGYKPVTEIIREYHRAPLGFERELLNFEPRKEGAIFSSFSTAHPYVIDKIVLTTAPTWRAIDFGHKDPSVCLWIQYDQSKQVYRVIDMIYKTGLAPSELARLILMKERELGLKNIVATWGDPSAAMARAELRNAGIYVLTKRIPKEKRVNSIKELLVVRANGLPGLQVCRNCKRLIDEMLAFDMERYSKGTKDDCVEALGYWAGAVMYWDYSARDVRAASAYRKRGSVEAKMIVELRKRLFKGVDPRPFSGSEL